MKFTSLIVALLMCEKVVAQRSLKSGKRSKKADHCEFENVHSTCVEDGVGKEITEILECVSKIEDGPTPGTPQARAWYWMVYADKYPKSTETEMAVSMVIQRYALAVYYYATHGDTWSVCSADEEECNAIASKHTGSENFLSPVSECEWFSIGCHHDMVTDIINDKFYMSGSLPREIGEIVDLEHVLVSPCLPFE